MQTLFKCFFHTLFLYFIYSQSIFATAQIEVLGKGGPGTYEFIVHSVDEDPNTPAPSWCRQKGCIFGVMTKIAPAWEPNEVIPSNPHGDPLVTSTRTYIPANSNMMMSDINEIIRREHVGKVQFSASPLSYQEGTEKYICFVYYYISGGLRPLPNHVCVWAPPTPEPNACYVTNQNLEIDHGTLSSSGLNGNTATIDMVVRCQKPNTKVRFGLQSTNDGKITLIPGKLFSRIQINNKDLSNSDSIVEGNTRFTVKSILEASGKIEAGTYSKTEILTIMFP